MSKPLSRRQLLQVMAAAAAQLGLGALTGCAPSISRAEDGQEHQNYLPLITAPQRSPTEEPTEVPTEEPTEQPTEEPTEEPAPTGSRVVHVYAADATSWDFSTGWYGDYVDQDVVNAMVDEGLKQLTDRASIAEAWRVLLPRYAPGEGIALKVNLNNSSCTDTDNIIDALIEPVNALVRGMKLIGVREEDIWIYDALKRIPDRFRTRCLYPGVRFFDSGACAEPAGFANTDPDAEVRFSHPNLTGRRITDLLVNATYLINMPIVKDHGIAGVTLGFKNHFGSIHGIIGPGENNLHYYISQGDSRYDPDYNPMVELYTNRHVRDKTVLIVGDGLYGALGNTNVSPSRWVTFDNDAANSLFFATDPVAIDCVMLDILDADPEYHPRLPGTDDYLRLAANAGLGVFERGDPWGVGYRHITYLKTGI